MSDCERDDATLLAEWLRQGCERSFRRLVERYAGLVYQAAKRRSGDDTIAAEASQATFILLARKARALTGRTSLAGWLHVTAVHQARNLQRRQMRETRKRQRLGEEPPAFTGDGAWQHMQPELDHALAGLSAPDREALLLRYYRSLSVKEIAASLGVSGEAAQKRLTRATERLRTRLSARGCVLPATAIAAGLAGFAGDAKAGLALAPALGSKALAAAAATTPFATLTTFFIMTKKSALLTTAAVALLGLGTYAVLRQPSSPDAGTAQADKNAPRSVSTTHTGTEKTDPATGRASRERPAAANYPDLAQKYGESRTNLSRHVVDGFLGVLDEALEFGKDPNLAKIGGGPSLGKLTEKLNLTPDQQEAALKILADRQQRQIEQAQVLSAAMHQEPRQLVELTLASDARARNQISQEEYETVAKQTAEFIKSSSGSTDLNLGMRNHGDRDALFNDPESRAGFEKILDPAQTETFQQLAAEKPQAAEDPATANITKTFPPMELEKLDQTLTSTRSMMEGAKKMLEGVRNMPKEGLGE